MPLLAQYRQRAPLLADYMDAAKILTGRVLDTDPKAMRGSTRLVTAPFVDRLHRPDSAYRTRYPHPGYVDALRRGSLRLSARGSLISVTRQFANTGIVIRAMSEKCQKETSSPDQSRS